MELAQMINDKNTIERGNMSNLVCFSYQKSTPLIGQKTQTFGVSAKVPKHTIRRLKNANDGVIKRFLKGSG